VLALGAAVTEVVEGAAPGLGVRGRRPTTMWWWPGRGTAEEKAGGQQLRKRPEGQGSVVSFAELSEREAARHQEELRDGVACRGRSGSDEAGRAYRSRARGTGSKPERKEASNHWSMIRCAGMELSLPPFHDRSWSIHLGHFHCYASHLISISIRQQ
jgi:hypothetical protein